MARENGGGGGAFGWTLLGFLAGVAATLAIQTLMSGQGGQTPNPVVVKSAAPPANVEASSAAPAPKPEKKPALAAASATPAPAQPSADVADDAAAAGMTTRVTPQAPANDATSSAN